MDNPSSPSPNNAPQPEVLKPRAADGGLTPQSAPQTAKAAPKKAVKRSYRPSHKATFVGLGVVMAILAVNAAVIGLVLKKQNKDTGLAAKGQVSISTSTLNQLGINRSAIGSSKVQLTIAPDTQFKGKISVDGTSSFGGDILLNGKLTGTDGNFTQLEAGNASLSQLNVNGNGTLDTLNLRKDLVVKGVTQLQSALTVNNSATITGNLTIGGVLSVGAFSARSLTSVSTFTVGGHIITGGSTPGVSHGGAVGSNGTVSISGNDAAGAISVNIGVGAIGGTLANVTFHTAYGGTPRVVISPVGVGANFYVLNLSPNGFSVGVTSGLAPGGFVINYIVEQ
jgi:hypothetical protein